MLNRRYMTPVGHKDLGLRVRFPYAELPFTPPLAEDPTPDHWISDLGLQDLPKGDDGHMDVTFDTVLVIADDYPEAVVFTITAQCPQAPVDFQEVGALHGVLLQAPSWELPAAAFSCDAGVTARLLEISARGMCRDRRFAHLQGLDVLESWRGKHLSMHLLAVFFRLLYNMTDHETWVACISRAEVVEHRAAWTQELEKFGFEILPTNAEHPIMYVKFSRDLEHVGPSSLLHQIFTPGDNDESH